MIQDVEMEEIINDATEKLKRVDFLMSLVREKTEDIAEINKEIATLRKKNGKFVKTDIDILIYQNNRKIDALNNSISGCKDEIKKIRSEVGLTLAKCYATAVGSDVDELKKLLEKTYEGKAEFTTAESVGGIQGDCDIVYAITTNERKKRYSVARLIRAGIRTDAGKSILKPQIEVYDYKPKEESGVRREETNDFKIELEKQRKGRTAIYFGDIFESKINIIYLALSILAFCISFGIWGMGENFKMLIEQGFMTRLSIVTLVSLCAFSTMTLKTAQRGGIADYLPIFSFVVGIVFLITQIVGICGMGLVFPIFLTLYGIAFIALRCLFRDEDEKTDKEYCLLAGAVLGGITAYAYCGIFNYMRAYAVVSFDIFKPSYYDFRICTLIMFFLISLAFAIPSAIRLMQRDLISDTPLDSALMGGCTFTTIMAVTLDIAPWKHYVIVAVAIIYVVAIIYRQMRKRRA